LGPRGENLAPLDETEPAPTAQRESALGCEGGALEACHMSTYAQSAQEGI